MKKKPIVEKTSASSLAAQIDHTLLNPDATQTEIEQLCREARQFHFATVCIHSSFVELAAELLKNSSTRVITVVGFPFGTASSTAKAFEASEAIRLGAKEIDMVINKSALKSKNYAYVFEDIKKVVDASHPYPVKVILETSNLTEEEKIIACALSQAAGAAFVKTSTGYSSGGATVQDIQLMRKIVGPKMGVKASGGIRTREDAMKMIQAGANRIGASASVAIVSQRPQTISSQKKSSKNKKESLY